MDTGKRKEVHVVAAAECRPAVDPLRLAVGEVYDSGIRRWPGQELILTTKRCLALVTYIQPTPAQIDEFCTAEAVFAWIDTRHNGILACRFGVSLWQVLSFNPHRDTPEGKTAGVPDIAAGQRLPFSVGLAEHGEAPVLAIRTVEWPEHFAATVGATVRRLVAQPYDAENTINESNCLYLYVGAEKLVQRAVTTVKVTAAEGDHG
jgi:hypothetical protein